MAKTKQGPFDETYHHIEAPTVQDEEYGRETKKRKLIIPDRTTGPEAYRDPTYYYLRNAMWNYSRKVDGENIRICWDGEQALWNGKSNAFVCNMDFHEYMDNTFLEEIFEEKFGRDKRVIIFGEKMGKKTQGNELGLDKDEVIVYDVNVNGTWLAPVDVKIVASYFGVRTVYDLMEQQTHEDSLVKLIHDCSVGKFKDWEGIVAHPTVELRTQKGNRIIVKIKNKDYYRDEGKMLPSD